MSKTAEKVRADSTQTKCGKRDAKGRFGKGNPGGPGNPYARQTAEIRRKVREATTDEDFEEVHAALLKRAKEGNVPAIRLFYSYYIGQPVKGPHPDRVDFDEWEIYRQRKVIEREEHDVSYTPQPDFILEAARKAGPLLDAIYRDDRQREAEQAIGSYMQTRDEDQRPPEMDYADELLTAAWSLHQAGPLPNGDIGAATEGSGWPAPRSPGEAESVAADERSAIGGWPAAGAQRSPGKRVPAPNSPLPNGPNGPLDTQSVEQIVLDAMLETLREMTDKPDAPPIHSDTGETPVPPPAEAPLPNGENGLVEPSANGENGQPAPLANGDKGGEPSRAEGAAVDEQAASAARSVAADASNSGGVAVDERSPGGASPRQRGARPSPSPNGENGLVEPLANGENGPAAPLPNGDNGDPNSRTPDRRRETLAQWRRRRRDALRKRR